MFLITREITEQIEVKKSKFLCFLAPYADFESLKDALRQSHPKAAHIVWAYRHFNEFGQIVENSSDDGEPKGSSAPGVLNALRGAGLINVCCLVVRYFGGIKLGVGGLVRAYGEATNATINAANDALIEYIKKQEFSLFVPFALISRVEHFGRANNLEFCQHFINDGCEFIFMLTDEQKADLSAFASSLNLI